MEYGSPVRLHQIDLNLLVAFDVIYAERNLTRAAARLHLTQPTMSHALSRLRDLFGDPLFARGPRGMVPTPFAERLAGPIRRALGELERSLSVGAVLDPAQLQRKFHLGLRDVLESAWLPAIGARIASEAPGVELVVRELRPRRIAEELADGEVDCVADLLVPVDAAILHQPLVDDEMVLLVREDHPAVGRAKTIPLEQLLALSFVRVSSGSHSAAIEDHALDALGHRRRIAVRCHGHAAAVALVASSDLGLVVPSLYVPLLPPGMRAHALPFDVPVAIHLYWHSATDADPACRWLRDLVTSVAGSGSSTASMAPHPDVSFD